MDGAKVALLFDAVPPWADSDEPDDRSALLAEELRLEEDAPGTFRLALYEAVATQVADEEPPAVWETAQRLLDMGLDRRRVLWELVLTLNGQIQASLGEDRPFDPSAYAAALDRLPLPTAEAVEALMVGIVRDRQPIAVNELESMTMGDLGLPVGEQPYEALLDRVSDYVLAPDGPLALLAGDLVVEPESLCAGITLTHRLTEIERFTDRLTVNVDLVGFARRVGRLRTNLGGELDPVVLDDGDLTWQGWKGWLRPFPTDRPLAVRLEGEEVTVDALEHDPELDPTLAARLRSVYDAETAELGLPVAIEDLLLGLRIRDRASFATPQQPLTELCEAAGLEIRGSLVAHDEAVWENERKLHRLHRLTHRLEDDEDRRAALDVLEWFDDRTEDPDLLRRVAAALREPEVLGAVADEMLGLGDDPEALEATESFGEVLSATARRPSEVAVSRWLAAVVAERRADPLTAEAHLRAAVEADPGWGPAVDRLAWYLSDRGDARGAVRLWRGLGVDPEDDPDLAVVEPFARQAGPKLGRNDRCWCGSGRKFKVCHLGRPVEAALPDRVGWLCRKAAAYLERRGGAPVLDVYELASIRSGDHPDDERWARALNDPLVTDAALHELGWFERLLTERGPLLPEDEALLAASWALVDRTVYEIVESDPGAGVVVRDLRTAERLDVRERTFSHRARPGLMICGRAVPDGETHQFIGGLFTVPPGTEVELLDVLDEGDAYELVRYVAALERPPTLFTREDEPLVLCTARLEVPDTDAARAVFDRHYRPEGSDEWVELHTVDGDEEVIRATLRLDGRELTVETMSEERLERVLSMLEGEIEGVTLLADDRRPFDPAARPPAAAERPPAAPGPADPAVRGVLDTWRDRQELRWCDEPIPALDGLTPRQAAADPTRREALERLLVSFEHRGNGAELAGAVTMRPQRLRGLLGLDG